MRITKILSFLTLLSAAVILAACNIPSVDQVIELAATEDLDLALTEAAALIPPTETPLPPTPTPEPEEILSVCLGKEPQTLFFYAEASQAMWSVLSAIYDGPFDSADGEDIPVIFKDVTMTQESVKVESDTIILDDDQKIVAIGTGDKFTPSNPVESCGYEGCQVVWNNESKDVEMMQTVITYTLKDDLYWSDGTPLTAEDSVFSMGVNGMKGIKADRTQYNHTESYKAADAHTVVWKGIPGYTPAKVSDTFWIPLPKHLLMGMKAEELLSDENVNRAPLGWGPYQVTEWIPGEQITMERNPYYHKSDGTEPFYDKVVYHFFGNAGDNNLQALAGKACNIIDTSVDLSADPEAILEDVRDGKLSIYIRPELSWQQLTFGIDSLKEGRKANYTDYFRSVEARKAILQCIDRNDLNRQLFFGQAEIPVDFYPAGHQLHENGLTAIDYDPAAGIAALQALGWTDPDNDPATPLIAGNVLGVAAGTPFSVTLTVSESAQQQKAADLIRENLAQCGIEVAIDPQPLGSLYGQGPEGILFGRRFDLAMFAWSASNGTPCRLYRSDQIPTEANNWVGVNVGGFTSEAYDKACESGEGIAAVYAETLPVIPLWFNFSIAASDNTTCGISDRIGSRSVLWNIEDLYRSDTPCAVSQWTNIY